MISVFADQSMVAVFGDQSMVVVIKVLHQSIETAGAHLVAMLYGMVLHCCFCHGCCCLCVPWWLQASTFQSPPKSTGQRPAGILRTLRSSASLAEFGRAWQDWDRVQQDFCKITASYPAVVPGFTKKTSFI